RRAGGADERRNPPQGPGLQGPVACHVPRARGLRLADRTGRPRFRPEPHHRGRGLSLGGRRTRPAGPGRLARTAGALRPRGAGGARVRTGRMSPAPTLARARRLLSRVNAWIEAVPEGYALRTGSDRRARIVLMIDEAVFRG